MKYLVKTTIKTNYKGEYQYRVFEESYDRQISVDNTRYVLCKLKDELGSFVVYPKNKLFTLIDDIHDKNINSGLNYLGNGEYIIGYNFNHKKYLVYNKSEYNFRELTEDKLPERIQSDVTNPNLIFDIEIRMDNSNDLKVM